MCCAIWSHVRDDLASTRRDAAAFLDNLDEIFGGKTRRDWVSRWMSIGDAHCLVGDLNIGNGLFKKATEAWLCGLTAFEVARRLLDDNDPQSEAVSAKVEACIQKFVALENKLEQVKIPCFDQLQLPAYYLPAGSPTISAPAVICISREEETGAMLLGRLLPAVTDRPMSLLIVSHDDVSHHWRGQSESLLSSCLDYLSLRSDVDAACIGVYGEGLSAVLATDFAASDRRAVAAVCDGGLWNWAWNLASVSWVTGADVMDEEAVSAHRSRVVQQLRCPVLVVAGGRGIVSVSEANKLQVDCAGARVDLELTTPRTVHTPVGEIENFVTSDDCIFTWLEHKLTPVQLRDHSQSQKQ